MIFVLTGNGKGKTTSAIGMGVRAAGAGKRVLMIQFLKAGGYSEEKAIAGVNNFKIKSFGRSCFVLSANELQATEFPPKAGTRLHSLLGKDFELAKQGWEMAKNAVAQNECDFLILDEIP